MELGAFSVSLAVKDIEASKLFYEKLGFTVFAGDQSQNWLIMKNGDHAIGLFQGKNIAGRSAPWPQPIQSSVYHYRLRKCFRPNSRTRSEFA
jgi:lactoylglutathione lyase